MTFDEFMKNGGKELTENTLKAIDSALNGTCDIHLKISEDGHFSSDTHGNKDTILLAVLFLLDNIVIRNLNKKGHNYKEMSQRNTKEMFETFKQEADGLEEIFSILRSLYIGMLGKATLATLCDEMNPYEIKVFMELLKAKGNGKLDDIIKQMKDFEK